MFEQFSQFGALLKQARDMQGRVTEMQNSLRKIKVEGSAGAGMVTVEANGQQQLLSCRIDPSLLEGNDREMLEDLVVAAVNQALDKSREAAAQEMQSAVGGEMPGLQDLIAKLGLKT